MSQTKHFLSLLPLLAASAPASSAFARAEFETSFYQDALSRHTWANDCVAGTLELNAGRSAFDRVGEAPWSSDSIYVSYIVHDRCSGPFIRSFGGSATIEQPLELDEALDEVTVHVDVEILGAECTQTASGYECTERSFPLAATLTWVGVGEISRVFERSQDPQNGTPLRTFEAQDRQAQAAFSGSVDGELLEYSTNDASFTRIVEKTLRVSTP